LISHHGEYEFGSPKLPMIREALVFHYLDDLDSKMAAARTALALESGDEEWSAYSAALQRKFLKLDRYLRSGEKKKTDEASPWTEKTAEALSAQAAAQPAGQPVAQPDGEKEGQRR
jgi:3'-5' exoribonuclease